MTEEELQAEWAYRYNERLAILGAYDTPTPEQHTMASEEADAAIAELRKQDTTYA